jgi:prolyl oligopeptidase
MRIHRLLIWILALMLNATGSATEGEPEDPYEWLEDVSGAKPLTWAKERNAETAKELTRSADFRALERRVLQILDSEDRIPIVQKLGPNYYNFWRDGKNPRGVWRRTTLDEYKKTKPTWEIVLDLDRLGEEEKENWLWHGAQVLKPDYQRALVSLSRGGADASVVREFDLTGKAFVSDGFRLAEAKSQVAWRNRDCVFVGTDFGPGSLTESGYPRIAKEWRRGTPLAEAALIEEGLASDMSVSATRDLTPGFERDIVVRRPTFWTSEVFLRRGGKLVHIDKPADSVASLEREWLLLRLRSEWKVGDKTYSAGALIAADLERFLEGSREFETLFEPDERKALASFTATRDFILVTELDNVRSRVYVLNYRDGSWHREPLPGVPDFGDVSVQAIDPDRSDDYFLHLNDFLTPNTLALGTIGSGPAIKLKQLPSFFDAGSLAVSQHEAVSPDGTRVPYFMVARKDLSANGKNPTLLYGYGGFEISMLPSYRPSVGAAWLEKGGVFVVANIRGGGEFGPKWHQSAMKANRYRAYDDFIAVGEDLVRRNVTTPAHLGIQGGSNGGLLMGNMLVRRPELFGAIVCQVPLLDMRRYNHLLAGASWIGEYGNPDLPEEWAFIRTFSPYHIVERSAKYPRTLFTTSTRDDRVHPGHARKMVAKMKDQGHDVIYYENIEGGHGGAADNKQAAFMHALAYQFLWNELTK